MRLIIFSQPSVFIRGHLHAQLEHGWWHRAITKKVQHHGHFIGLGSAGDEMGFMCGREALWFFLQFRRVLLIGSSAIFAAVWFIGDWCHNQIHPQIFRCCKIPISGVCAGEASVPCDKFFFLWLVVFFEGFSVI